MEKIINIGDKSIKFKCTLGTFNRYRMQFNKDPLTDLTSLEKRAHKKAETGEDFDLESLFVFMNFAWCMAKTADKDIPEVEDWLDQFEIFNINIVLPQLMDLLTECMKQTNDKKKLETT